MITDLRPKPADVLLRDGTIAVVRRATAADLDALERLHAEVSDDSLRLRFFSPSRHAAHQYVAHLGRDQQVLTLVVEHRGQVVAVATAEPVEPGAAEVAFLVADGLHGKGIGSLLLEHLAAAGRDRGLRRFVAEVLPDNRAMLGVFLDAGFCVTRRPEAGSVHLEMDTLASAEAVAAADERERRAETRSLQPLLYPRSVVVAGVRRTGDGVGAAVLRSIVGGGYAGSLAVVHPHASETEGVRAYPRLGDVPFPIDLLVLALPAPEVLAILDGACGVEIPAAVVISSGFAEAGAQGARLQRRLLDLARRRSIRVVGPNCLGVLSNDPAILLNATFSGSVPPLGGVAVASQSGGVGIVLTDVAREIGLGVECFVSLGNKVDVSGNDLLAAWQDDPRVTAAALYLESFGNASKFARFARDFAERKPLLAVVGGRSAGGRRAGASHTAAAATPAVGVDALFAQAGVIGCAGAEDLAETALFLTEQPLPAGPRIAILSNAGGMGVLAADAAEDLGLAVPELSAALRSRISGHLSGTTGTGNPVDAGAGARPHDLASIAAELLDSDEIDALVVILVATGVADAAAALNEMTEVRRQRPRKPLVAVPMGGLTPPPGGLAGITTYRSALPGLRAIARAARYHTWLGADPDRPRRIDRDRAERSRAVADHLVPASVESGGWLDPEQAAELLTDYGLAVSGRLVRGDASIAAAAAEVGYPVAVKVAGPEYVHKTDLGLVRVGVQDEGALLEAVRDFEQSTGLPDLAVLVQPMAAGVEIALGLVRDAGFGPLVMVAAGGVATDVWDDRAFLMPPIGRRDAERALRSLRIWPLLDGYRGAAPTDQSSLQQLIVGVGQLADDVPHVAELDLNPVLVGPGGSVLVDVKVRLSSPSEHDDGVPRRLRREA